MFQRFKQRGRTSGSAGPQVVFAAFGKHPGWDDHMPDLGEGTETLALLKQTLYVGGIGGQIDSGAWEQLDPGKRIEGFDHTFLWMADDRIVLGQLWSSSDRKGRTKYPMAVCVEGAHLPLALLLGKPRQVLAQVRDGMRATTSANHVVLESRTAQEQLSAWLSASGPTPNAAGPASELKARFLAHPALGPDSIGLLRVLHELENATGRSQYDSDRARSAARFRAYHVRVPWCADSLEEALQLWAAFLQTAVPGVVPVVLIARHTGDSLDIILGDPASDDLFCLQAGPQALPLATAIPYDIAPELRARLQQLRAAFLGPTHAEVTPQTIAQETPVAPSRPANASPGTGKQVRPLTLGLGALILAAVCLALGFWLRPKLAPVQIGESQTTPKPGPRDQVVSNARPATVEEEKPGALAVAEALFTNGKLDEARQQALAGLKAQPTDPAINDLLKRIEQRKLDDEYQAALASARAAFDRAEYTNAIKGAEAALALRQNPEASKVKADAQAELNFQAQLKGAQAAFDAGNYRDSIQLANAALTVHGKDGRTLKLRDMAEARDKQETSDRERDTQYQNALNAGRAALQRHDLPAALAKANAALALKSSGPEAAQLKAAAQQELAYDQASAAFAQAEYDRTLSLCQPYRGAERFDGLLQRVMQEQNQLSTLQKAFYEGVYPSILNASLPAKTPFDKLKSQAAEENRALQDAKQRLTQGDYTFVPQLESQSYKTKPPFRTLLDTGRTEQAALAALLDDQKAGRRDSARQGLAKLSPEVRGKRAFAEVERWSAQKEPDSGSVPSPKAPAPSAAANYEAVLHALEIRFGLKPEEANLFDREGNPVRRETNLSKAKRTEATTKVRFLKEYRNDGWLTDDRKARLQKIEEAIRNWKE